MEAALGSILALVLAMKFTDYRSKQDEATIASLQGQITALSEQVNQQDNEMAKKMMVTLLPVAKAVQRLNQEVGIQ